METTDTKVVKLTTENFDEQVLRSEQPVLVDFYADWCGPCQALGPVVDQLAADYEGRARIGKLDVDAAGEVAQRYGVQSIPTLLFVKNGEVVDQVVGAMPGSKLAEKLDSML